MLFPKIRRKLREANAPKRSLLGVDRLDDRIVPASLVDVNSSFLGAGDRPANILGMSDNGRYIIFESAATNLITGQQDIPDTNDLFWKDLQTGDTRLVTALPGVTDAGYDYSVSRLAPQSFSFLAITDGVLRPSFSKAVISSDGTAVAFSSVANAARLDDVVANSKYNPASGNNQVTDLDNTLDVFRWNSSDGQINLASRTLPQGGATGGTGTIFAFGRFGAATTPALSRDGSYVGFVSQVDAGYTNDTSGFGSFTGFSILDGGTTNDVFVTLFQRDINNKVSFLKSSALSAIGAVFSSTNNITTQFDEARTFGHAAGGTGVSVDPNGRYFAEDGAGNVSIVFTAPVDVSSFGFLGGGTGGSRTTSGNSEAFRVEVQSALEGDLTRYLLTATDGKATGNNGITKAGGNAQNAIVGVSNPNGVVVSTSVAGAGGGVFNPTPQTPNATRQDLYYVRTDINSQAVNVLNTARLPNTATSTTVADTTLYTISPNGQHVVWTQVEGVRADGADKTQVYYRKALPSVSAATLISVAINGLQSSSGATFPRVSPNGRYVTFTSDTPANQIANVGLSDTNGVNDVFVRDLFGSVNAKGQFIATTQLLSTNSAGTGAANGASSRGYVGTNLEDPTNGISPSQTADSVGRSAFNSLATNIDAGFIPTHGGSSVFTQPLPVGGVPPTVPPTDAPRTGAVSGGRDAGIAQISYTDAGTVVLGARLTPFPGYTGELRVATADVNGDTIVDTIVAAGKGVGSRVIVYNGSNGSKLFDFFGYGADFTGGVNVAAADINGDGKAEVILGADAGGGARVRVLDVNAGKTLVDFFAYNPEFRGGVRVATGDFNGDGVIDVLTGAGTGGGPRVSAFSGVEIKTGTLNRFIDFFAMELNLRNGVTVAGGDMNNDGTDDIIVGSGAGGAPRVRVFESGSVIARPGAPDLLYDFFAGNTDSRAGIRVAVKNVDGDAIADIVTGEGFGRESRVRSFSGAKFSAPLTPTEIQNNFVVFNDLTSLNGAWVG